MRIAKNMVKSEKQGGRVEICLLDPEVHDKT